MGPIPLYRAKFTVDLIKKSNLAVLAFKKN